MTIMKIIDGLYFTIGMILFNPLTGESKTPDQLNEDDRATYDACMGAIALLKAQEPIMVKYTTSTIRCPKCNKQITSRGSIHNEIKYCWKCGQAVKWK